MRRAAEKGRIDVVRLLLDAGADVDQREGSDWTALFSAASEGHLEVVELLLDAGADFNVKDGSGETPLAI